MAEPAGAAADEEVVGAPEGEPIPEAAAVADATADEEVVGAPEGEPLPESGPGDQTASS